MTPVTSTEDVETAADLLERLGGISPAEMDQKRGEYFRRGVRLLWVVTPNARTVAVYTRADAPDAVLTAADTLTGGDVLPGFSLPLANLFAVLDRRGKARTRPERSTLTRSLP